MPFILRYYNAYNNKRINDKRDREGNEAGLSLKEMGEMGDTAPTFRYML